MNCVCIRHTELPHTAPLFADYLYRFAALEKFYGHAPFDAGAYRSAAAEIDMPADRRKALVDALAIQNPGSRLLGRLADPGTVAVVTGQQVGLFSGPCYTIYKALTAVKLARRLTESGTAAVPVFWLATEDHDFAEIAHCWVFDSAGGPVRVEVAPPRDAAERPVGNLAVSTPPLAELRAALSELPFGEEVCAEVENAYVPQTTFGDAFRRLLSAMLGGQEMLYLDPMLPEIRRLAAPALHAALAAAPELSESLAERTRALIAAGYHGQVHVENDTSLVFLLDQGRRLALKRHGNEYVRAGKRYDVAEIAARAEDLSPNALLRPVVQDFMLPTVAYVGGPAELAYFAQSEVIYRRLLGRMPVAVPRAGMTLFDGRSRKLLDRYGLQPGDFFHGLESLRERMSRSLTPPEIREEMASTRAAAGAALAKFDGVLAGFDPTLRAAFEKSRGKIDFQLSKTERKIWREHMRRDERAARDSTRLFNLVYPEKHLQERLYSILPFLASHGPDLIGAIYDSIQLDCPDHQLVTI